MIDSNSKVDYQLKLIHLVSTYYFYCLRMSCGSNKTQRTDELCKILLG